LLKIALSDIEVNMKTAITTTLDLSSLPEQARQEVTDFYNFLKTKYRQRTAPPKPSSKHKTKAPVLSADSGFVGMWSDRPEMSDPTKWVSELRENSWSRHE
jgi:hypothetical protein